MTAKIIAENILDADDFLSATEQEGERIGQPVPGTNTGAFRLLSKGDIADFSYSGTATTDGAAGGTTVIDSVLNIYGDDYFIDGTVAIDTFIQDTDDYTEEDVPGRVTITDAHTLTITDLDDDEVCYVYYDLGAGHFDHSIVFHTQINCTALGGIGARCGLWALTNILNALTDIDTASGDFLAVTWASSVANGTISLIECNAGSLTLDTSSALSSATEYYLKIVIDLDTGTFGTVYCYIYTGSIDGVLVDTLTVTLTKTVSFRYLHWMISYNQGTFPGSAWDGTIKNFKVLDSESKAISDFAQATGTLTTAAFSYRVNTGTTFTLTVPFSTRDFHVELIASGDPGDATFKWSHDGGTTYLGRDNPNQAAWLGEKLEVLCSTTYFRSKLIECNDGSWLLIYNQRGGDTAYYVRSTDQGTTWSAELGLHANDFEGAFKLASGRVVVMFPNTTGNIVYSDDHGVTWSAFTFAWSTGIPISATELFNGNVIGVFSYSSIIYCQTSADGGLTWSAPIEIANDANNQNYPSVVQAANGDIVVAYQTDEDSVGDIEIKCKISSDGGATWGSAIAVMNFAADITYPTLCKDINGDLYCAAAQGGDIDYTISTDNGATWTAGAIATLHDSGDTLGYPSLAVMGGNQIVCTYGNTTDNTIESVRRGIWEAFSANACPVAIDAIEQKLICDVGMVWHGGAGIDGDTWTFEPEYVYSMANLVEDSPSKPWRSEQDGIECNIIIDMGANNRLYADGVGFFGANFRQLNFQMHTANSWALPTGPDVWERVDFNIDGRDGGVYVTAGATASIIIADDPDIDFATGNFTIRAVRTLSTWKPTANKILVQKLTGGVGYQLEVVATTGIIRLTLNATVYNSSVAPTATDGSKGAVAAFVTVGAVSTTVDFSFNGAALGTQQSAANPGTVSSAADLYLMGTSAVRTAGIDGGNTLYNRALTHAQLLTQYETGEVADADQWGSQTARLTSDFSGGANGFAGSGATVTGNIDGIELVDDVLRAWADGGNTTHLAYRLAVFTAYKRVKIVFDYYIPAANTNVDGLYVGTGNQDFISGLYNTTGSWQTGISLELFVDTSNTNICFYEAKAAARTFVGANSVLDDLIYVKNVVVTQIGATLDLEAKTLNDSTWPDMTTNELTATLPAAGAYQNGDVCGTISSVAGNVIGVTYLELSPKDHELKGRYFRATSGTDKGTVWKISDNMNGYIYLDTTAAHNMAADDYFGIFQSHISKTFTAGIKRYLRINIPAQETAEGYYQLGMMVAGRAVSLDKEWGPGYRKRNQYDIEMLRTPHGGMTPVKGAERKRVFELAWPTSEAARLEVVALSDYIEGRNLCFIPDSDDMTKCYLVKLTSDIEQTHRARNYFDFTIILEENL